MSLREYWDVEQDSDEWYELRRGIVTASVMGLLVTPKTIKPAANDHSRGIFALLASERITGWTDPSYVGADMMRGHEEEPLAAESYAELHGVDAVSCGFMVRDDWGYEVGFSPDRLVGDVGFLEIKSRRPKVHVQVVTKDVVPEEHMAQIQTGLWVSGRAWCDYVDYCAGMELWTKRVYPDPVWFEAIEAATRAAEEAINELVIRYQTGVVGMPKTERRTELDLVIGPNSAWT